MKHHPVTKHRLQMSTLLLFLLGLCSIASPHNLKHATVHHRAPVHASRTSRDIGRARTSSSRTSAEAEVEPEIPVHSPYATVASSYTYASVDRTPAKRSIQTSVAQLPQPPPALNAPRMVCISCASQDDLAMVAPLSFRPDLGRAPPLA